MSEERTEWMRNLFNALTSKRISRNKQFASFSSGWAKVVLQRFRILRALLRETERLAAIPDTTCWVSDQGQRLLFHLECPRMRYKRVVALHGFEWDWLGQHNSVQALLTAKSLQGPDTRGD